MVICSLNPLTWIGTKWPQSTLMHQKENEGFDTPFSEVPPATSPVLSSEMSDQRHSMEIPSDCNHLRGSERTYKAPPRLIFVCHIDTTNLIQAGSVSIRRCVVVSS
jgi:hypothetical protein